AEVRGKLSQFVRARWFEPPFGGEVFSNLLIDAFDAMAAGPKGPVLVPDEQPVDLMVTVTEFSGHEEFMRLNSPSVVEETEHRRIFSFRRAQGIRDDLSDIVGLAFAARATASFPGAFPPFTAREMDRALAGRQREWPSRADFLTRQLPGMALDDAQDKVLVDGSVLANAPFRPAIGALRQRPARREVDRRFVYIDPKPGRRAISFGGRDARRNDDCSPMLPGFFGTILKTMSDIPREQPIRDNVEALEAMSQRIWRKRGIVDSMRGEVEQRIESALGHTFFLDHPTAARLTAWRAVSQDCAAKEAGYSFVAYGHLKISIIVDDLARVIADARGVRDVGERAHLHDAVWAAVRQRGADHICSASVRVNPDNIAFFRAHDLNFRIRRLRYMARRLDEVAGIGSTVDPALEEMMRSTIYTALGPYLDREARDFYATLSVDGADAGGGADVGAIIDRIGTLRALTRIDEVADGQIASALAQLPKPTRRAMLHAYLGFPFYDAATLPLLQGEGQGEFDPIKIDRISPEDATAIRAGGAAATLKGIQFNSFGAFFSRAFRENDYLWGRLQAAERMISIIASTVPAGTELPPATIADFQRQAFHAILDEEEGRLNAVPDLFRQIRAEVVAATPAGNTAAPIADAREEPNADTNAVSDAISAQCNAAVASAA
ncbi:MAG: patatin-like protein, partial [Sphingopyxis sp.]